MADWFVDSAATGARDGTSTTDAWNSILTPLSTVASSWILSNTDTGGPVNTAGDIVWIKSGHVETWDLTALSRIIMTGFSPDQWNPVQYRTDFDGVHFASGSTLATVNMQDGTANAYFDTNANDRHYYFEGINFDYQLPNGTTATTTMFDMDNCSLHFVNCGFRNFGGNVIRHIQGGNSTFDSCIVDSTGWTGTGGNVIFQVSTGHIRISDCTVTGGRFQFNPANNRAVIHEIYDTTFDERNQTGGGIFWNGDPSNYYVIARNVKFGDFDVAPRQTLWYEDSKVEITDYDGNPRLFKNYYMNGTIESEEPAAADLPPDGADQVIILTPNSQCNYTNNLRTPEIPFWAESGVSHDYSVQVKADGWGTAGSANPDADELVIEIGYYDTSSDATRTYVATTDTVSGDDSWTTITISGINPSESGGAFLRARLKTNDGGTGETIRISPAVRLAG